jgi:hypothetical protein
MIARTQRTSDPLAHARGLAIVVGGAVLIAGVFGWGRVGLVAAAIGTAISLVNVWALRRLALRAVANVAVTGSGSAAAQLSAALGAKTMVLLVLVWLVSRAGAFPTVPFALGLLVTVFALLGAGLWSALSGGEA